MPVLSHYLVTQYDCPNSCYQNPSLDTIISQCHKPFIFTIDFPKFHVNIVLPSLPRSTKWPLSFKSSGHKFSMHSCHPKRYALNTSHDCNLYSPYNNISYLNNKNPVYRTTYIYGLPLEHLRPEQIRRNYATCNVALSLNGSDAPPHKHSQFFYKACRC